MAGTLVLEPVSLTAIEVRRREELESTIDAHAASYFEVGRALAEIREGKLYRSTHKSFREYCLARWGMSKTHANRLVQSAEVIANVTPIGVIPETEYQTRPLIGLIPEKQREVWAEAVATAPDGKVTANHVASVVRKRSPKPDTPKPADPAEPDEIPKRKGRGIELAHEAIAVLKRISSKDALRDEGLRIVARWIKDNR